MSKFSVEDIDKAAILSRIQLPKDSKEQLLGELSTILDFVQDLQSLDTDSLEPVSQVTGLQDVWREDEVVDCDISREDLLSNAPSTQDGYFKVRKVL